MQGKLVSTGAFWKLRQTAGESDGGSRFWLAGSFAFLGLVSLPMEFRTSPDVFLF